MEEIIEKYYKITQSRMGKIIPKKTALIIVDMQKYQVKKEFGAYKAANSITPGILDFFIEDVERKLIPNLRILINFCRKVEIPIIFTKFSSFMPDGSDLSRGKKGLNKLAQKITGEVIFPHVSYHGSDIIDELKPINGDFILQKNTSGTFTSTRLEYFLKNMGVETVLVTGVLTNFCVYATAREASDHGFGTFIVEDCCSSWSPEFHKSILKTFGTMFGFVLTHDKVIKKIVKVMEKSEKKA